MEEEDGIIYNSEPRSCPVDHVHKKINFRQKNIDHIEKLKEKRIRQQQTKQKDELKDQSMRQKLKRQVLEDAIRTRQNKEREYVKESLKELILPDSFPKKSRSRKTESLPKVINNQYNNKRHKNRYMSFLTYLSDGIKQKKILEELQHRRKEEQYVKLKEELGVDKVESKFSKMLTLRNEPIIRSQSTEKFASETVDGDDQKNIVSNKEFRDKTDEYIEKIKSRKERKNREKQQFAKRKEKIKAHLKEYVLTTVKQNVIDGVYDDQIHKSKSKNKIKNKQQSKGQQNDDVIHQQSSCIQQQVELTPPIQKKKKRNMREFPHVSDLIQWKRKNRLTPQNKVFIVTGGYLDVKKALRSRGWVENPGYSSPCFDLKWTLQGKEIEYNHLQDSQVVNHYEKNGIITTKVGLCRTLKNMHWVCNINVDDFFPKCFDLNDDDDCGYFETYFKISKAQSVLKLYMKLYGLQNEQQVDKLKPRAKIALEVCQRNILDVDEIIDKKKPLVVISAKQWQILAQDELNAKDLAQKKHEEWLHSIDNKFNEHPLKKKLKKKSQAVDQKDLNFDVTEDLSNADEFTKTIYHLLQDYQKRFPQYNLVDTHNIWILKPAGLSRGRGITCYNNFIQIKDHIKSKESLWVAQKYIENPLIVCKRKFDIRQWVLITDFNPLIIWYYEECYIRFSVLDYDAEDVNNKFVHLTNNAIACLHKNFEKSEIEGSMFSMEQFRQHLIEKEGYDVFNEVQPLVMQKLKPQMKDIVKWSMQSAQQHIQNRKNSHELYGYDFMVDENYHVWLIEVNSSPSMDYSTHITERLVKQCLEDTVKVIVDYNSAPKKLKKTIDTGGYKLLYHGIEIPDKPITTGINLSIEGVAMKKGSKRPSIKPKVFNPLSETEPQSIKKLMEAEKGFNQSCLIPKPQYEIQQAEVEPPAKQELEQTPASIQETET